MKFLNLSTKLTVWNFILNLLIDKQPLARLRVDNLQVYLVGGLLMFASSLSAQIVYTDITDGVPAGIDFNGDGTNEFDVQTITGAGAYLAYWGSGPQTNVHAVGTPPPGGANWDVPSLVAAGFTIDANANWSGQGDCNINGFGTPNPTITAGQDQYLAVRIDISNSVYYGWVRINVNASGDVTYKDYAYNATPNTPIDAGASSSSVLVTTITVQGQGAVATVIDGNTLTMEATVLPANATNSGVDWSVTNGTGSATINTSTGVLTANSVGTVTVTATAKDGSGVLGTTVITITPAVILVATVTVQGQGGSTTVVSGNTLTMEATVLPANATNSGVDWSVTNGTGSATINTSTGVLTANNAGTVTVTATAKDGSGVLGTTVVTITQATSITSVKEATIRAYPNPMQDRMFIESEVSGLYQLYTLQGILVLEGKINEGMQQIEIKLPQGAYILHCCTEETKTTKMLMVE